MAGSQVKLRRPRVSTRFMAGIFALVLLLQNVCADVATQLDWDAVTWPSGSLSETFTVGSGDLVFTFNQLADTPPGDTSGFQAGTPSISTAATGALIPQEDTLFLNVNYPPASINEIPLIIDFTHPGGVSNFSFTIFDIDAGGWTDQLQVTATDGVNTFNPSSVIDSVTGDNAFDGVATVTGINGTGSNTVNGNATFTFNQSGITQVTIVYRNTAAAANPVTQIIFLHDIDFTFPEADLSINKVASGPFIQNTLSTYTLSVENDSNASAETGPIVVTDTLPATLAFDSVSGSGWACGASGQDITCTHPGPLAPGNALPDITLNVIPSVGVGSSITNTASVVGELPDSNPTDNSSSETITVQANTNTVDLAIDKSHVGIFNQNQNAVYTISVDNIAGTNNEPGPIIVTDSLPVGLSFNSVTGVGWSCGAVGQDVTCTHPGPLNAGAALADISLNVSVGASAVPTVTNTASVSGTVFDSDINNNSDSDTAIVIADQPAIIPGNKPLYLFSQNGNGIIPDTTSDDIDLDLSRTPPQQQQSGIEYETNDPRTWILTPVTQTALTIDGNAGAISVELLLSLDVGGAGSGPFDRFATLTLFANTPTGTVNIGTTGQQTIALTGTVQAFPFSIPIAGDITLPAGSDIRLTVDISDTDGTSDSRLFPETIFTTAANNGPLAAIAPGAQNRNSRVELTSETVIDVTSIQFFDAPFPGGNVITSVTPGSSVFVRAVVSDPFGSFDINTATITILDANSNAITSNLTLPEVADSGAATKTFEFEQVISATAPTGTWTALITAQEGTEGIVSDTDTNTFDVENLTPDIVFLKRSQVIDDGIAGNPAANLKAIPGATVLYTLMATNQGAGATDNDLQIVDPIPSNTSLCVADPCAGGADPILFINAPSGTANSGLIYAFASDVEFSTDSVAPFNFTYIPSPDAQGFDSAVRRIRISPSGQFNAASSGTPAGFEIVFRVLLQ